jgi:hypothetical protein
MNLLTNEIVKLKDDLYFFINKKFEQESEDKNIELKVSFLLNSILALASISEDHEKIILSFFDEAPEAQILISSALKNKHCSCKHKLGNYIHQNIQKSLQIIFFFLKRNNLKEIEKLISTKNKCLSIF